MLSKSVVQIIYAIMCIVLFAGHFALARNQKEKRVKICYYAVSVLWLIFGIFQIFIRNAL